MRSSSLIYILLGYPLFNSLGAFEWVCLVKELGVTSRYPCRQERLLAACSPATCMFPMYVLLPGALRELLHSTKPVLLLPKSGTFCILPFFPGCLPQHLCPQRSCLCPSFVPLCVRVCDCLWAVLVAVPGLLQMIFFILFEIALHASPWQSVLSTPSTCQVF